MHFVSKSTKCMSAQGHPSQAGLMFTYLPYIYYFTGRWKVVSDLGWCDCGDCFVTCGGSGTCLQLRYTFYVVYFNAETTSSLVHSSCIPKHNLSGYHSRSIQDIKKHTSILSRMRTPELSHLSRSNYQEFQAT
mgnify:CR=1 FL=1